MSIHLRCFVQLHITLSRNARNSVVVVSYQALHNLMYAAAEDSLMLQISHLEGRGIVQPMNKTKRCLSAVGLSSTALCLCFLICKKQVLSFIHTKKFICQFALYIMFLLFFFVLFIYLFLNLDTIV